MRELGLIIKRRRKEFGLTQAQLAEMAKVGVNTLTQIERGDSNPTVRVLEKILETLGLRLTITVAEL